MTIKEITRLANKIESVASLLVNDDTVTKLLFYDDEDPINKPSLTVSQKMGLMGTHIIKRNNVKILDNTAGSFVTIRMSESLPSHNNPSVLEHKISINIVCHSGNIQTKYGERDLLILQAIINIFNLQNTVGQNKTYINMVRDLVFNSSDFNGYVLIVVATEETED